MKRGMKKKIKVVHIITRFDKGGSAENTLLTVLGTDKKKYEVILVKGSSHESEMSRIEYASVIASLKKAKAEGIRIINIRSFFRRLNPIYDLLTFLSLFLFLLKEKPGIVHTHTSKAGFLGRLAAKLAAVPLIIHTPHGHVFSGYFGQFKTKMFIILERLATRMTDRIVALTNSEKEDYIKLRIADEDKVVVIHSGVDLAKFQDLAESEIAKIKSELGLAENSLVVGTAGRLVPVKGPEFLVEAARDVVSKHPETVFIFAGDGQLRQDLERRASKLGLTANIIFTGWRQDVARMIATFDIFVLPSLNEGMGRVLVEAMALGKPIVASDRGGIKDLVVQGKNGFLVPARNPRLLAKHIQILIEDKEKRTGMAREGKKMAPRFSSDLMMTKIASLYEELLTQKKSLTGRPAPGKH